MLQAATGELSCAVMYFTTSQLYLAFHMDPLQKLSRNAGHTGALMKTCLQIMTDVADQHESHELC